MRETHKLVPGDQVLGQNGGQLLAHLSVAPKRLGQRLKPCTRETQIFINPPLGLRFKGEGGWHLPPLFKRFAPSLVLSKFLKMPLIKDFPRL